MGNNNSNIIDAHNIMGNAHDITDSSRGIMAYLHRIIESSRTIVNVALTMLLLLTASTLPLQAQTVDDTNVSYGVRYEKAHLFLTKDSAYNVVDYDIEWPELIDFTDAAALKRSISNSLFHETTDCDSLLTALTTEYGSPVKGMFKTIPDDNRFCYITATAHILSYQPGRWIVYQVKKEVAPQKLSPYKASISNEVFVYDANRGRVFRAEDLISSFVGNMGASQDFYENLLAPLPDDIYSNLQTLKIVGAWVDSGALCMMVHATGNGQNADYTVGLPLEDNSYIFAREGRRLFLREPKNTTAPKHMTLSTTWHGDTIYNKVETMPAFKGGNEGLTQYLSHVTEPDAPILKAQRVFISYVVDKTGGIRDITVVTPATPALDRHAANIVREMPPYTPGKQNGQNVCTRIYTAINYKP